MTKKDNIDDLLVTVIGFEKSDTETESTTNNPSTTNTASEKEHDMSSTTTAPVTDTEAVTDTGAPSGATFTEPLRITPEQLEQLRVIHAENADFHYCDEKSLEYALYTYWKDSEVRTFRKSLAMLAEQASQAKKTATDRLAQAITEYDIEAVQKRAAELQAAINNAQTYAFISGHSKPGGMKQYGMDGTTILNNAMQFDRDEWPVECEAGKTKRAMRVSRWAFKTLAQRHLTALIDSTEGNMSVVNEHPSNAVLEKASKLFEEYRDSIVTLESTLNSPTDKWTSEQKANMKKRIAGLKAALDSEEED